MTSIEQQTKAAIDEVEAAGIPRLLAVENLDAIEAERAVEKLGAMSRLTLIEHPATPGKNFTASSAADFAQFDAAYAAYTERRAQAARWVVACEQALEVAKLRAEWAIALFKAGAGVEA